MWREGPLQTRLSQLVVASSLPKSEPTSTRKLSGGKQRDALPKVSAPSVLAIALPADFKQSAGRLNLIIDSGADYHVVGNRNLLLNIEPCDLVAQTAGGTDLDIIGVGTLQANLGIYTDTYGQNHRLDIEIPNVHYAPECPYNLLSVDLLRAEKIFLDSRF